VRSFELEDYSELLSAIESPELDLILVGGHAVSVYAHRYRWPKLRLSMKPKPHESTISVPSLKSIEARAINRILQHDKKLIYGACEVV
jgi:hypothetical protein